MCPRVMDADNGWMEFFEVPSADEALQMPKSKWRIPEPPLDFPRIEPEELDLLLVPCIALDLCRRRCGHGKGFYDRYISRARARAAGAAPCRTVGLGLAEQCLDEVPMDRHDELLDAVIFPDAQAVAEEESEPAALEEDPGSAACCVDDPAGVAAGSTEAPANAAPGEGGDTTAAADADAP